MSARARPVAAALAVLAVLAVWSQASPARAQALVADLSEHLIAISTDFTGTDVVLFGATDGPGEVAVVVRGPPTTTVVRRKRRIAGIWVNADSMTFADVPAYYWAGASAPVDDIAPAAVLERHGIGLAHLRLAPVDAVDRPPGEAAMFRRALVRRKQAEGTYTLEAGRVSFLGDRLFRSTLVFPTEVPTGQYTVSVLLFREGRVVSAQTTPLIVSKVGTGARVFAFARQHAAAYGAIAIAIAVAAGWLAGVAFRRS
ncbi:MAG: TIGR02186 family protein [Azospirillaceae bacterium]